MSAYKHEAIHALYSNVKRVNEDDDGVFTAYDADENVVIIDDSAVNTKSDELQAAADAEKTQKETDAANGNQKLLDLGLTQAEATALTGYKPTE